MSKKFKLKRGEEVITTSLPAEAVQLRAAGWADVKDTEADKPAPKSAKSTTTKK